MRPDMEAFLQRGNLDANSEVRSCSRTCAALKSGMIAETRVPTAKTRFLSPQMHKAVVRIQSRFRGYVVRKVPFAFRSALQMAEWCPLPQMGASDGFKAVTCGHMCHTCSATPPTCARLLPNISQRLRTQPNKLIRRN